jgi:hypothetical protein
MRQVAVTATMSNVYRLLSELELSRENFLAEN